MVGPPVPGDDGGTDGGADGGRDAAVTSPQPDQSFGCGCALATSTDGRAGLLCLLALVTLRRADGAAARIDPLSRLRTSSEGRGEGQPPSSQPSLAGLLLARLHQGEAQQVQRRASPRGLIAAELVAARPMPQTLSTGLASPRSGERVRERGPRLLLPLGGALAAPLPLPFSSRNAATQASGAFQLIAISLTDQASMLSTKHFCGAQPASPAAWT